MKKIFQEYKQLTGRFVKIILMNSPTTIIEFSSMVTLMMPISTDIISESWKAVIIVLELIDVIVGVDDELPVALATTGSSFLKFTV